MRLAAVACVLLLGCSHACAVEPTVLLERYKCYTCHGDSEAGAGPAFVDVAATWRGKPKAAATLTAIIRDGTRSGGPWHMPPHPEVTAADAKIMVRYILARKPPA